MAAASKDEIKTLTTRYIDGAFVQSHGGEVIDTVKPTNCKVIARVTLADASGGTHQPSDAVDDAEHNGVDSIGR